MDLSKIIKDPQAVLLDVREPNEFKGEQIEGSINIPLGIVPLRLDEIQAWKSPIVVYCLSGGRSGQAMAFLKSKGVEAVYNGGSIYDVARIRSGAKMNS